MGLSRVIRRSAPLIVIGVAGAVAARRRAQRLRHAQLMPAPPAPPPPPRPAEEPIIEEQPTVESRPVEIAPREEPPAEAPDPEQRATSNEQRDPATERTSVTDIVDDLLAPGGAEERIEDATVVEDDPESRS